MSVSGRPGAEASQLASRAANSKTVERIARLGFISRGFVYAFVGFVGFQPGSTESIWCRAAS